MDIFLKINNQQALEEIISTDYSITGLITAFEYDENLNIENKSETPIFLKLENNRLYQDDKQVGMIIQISSPDDMKDALKLENYDDIKYIIVETSSWHIIPLENLIAKFDGSGIKLLAHATNLEEVKLLENILEKGVDGCVLEYTDNTQQILAYLSEQTSTVELQEFEVTHIERIGLGDRVCVDTCSILHPGDGMLIGSTASLLILIEAEVHDSGFVNARPFRINAGVVALYTLNEEKTNYLSELHAGSSVMITSRDGRTRNELIARVKIERRPCVLIKLKYQDKSYPIILQDAETVRIVTIDASISVSDLQVGDQVLGHFSVNARHFGMKVKEFLEEK